MINVVAIALLAIFLIPLTMVPCRRSGFIFPGGKLEGDYFDLEVKKIFGRIDFSAVFIKQT
ncbi:MAG TPA: hypothetical protein GXZ27_09005 [Thermoanaerobacterales bacterium]|nr:hypothetical protein [Thermoanaerobacterales bacterium]